jgi:hypothetical protein
MYSMLHVSLDTIMDWAHHANLFDYHNVIEVFMFIPLKLETVCGRIIGKAQ